MKLAQRLFAGLVALAPITAFAATISNTQEPVVRVGASGLWILANISYAGMRAQNSSSALWRLLAFIFGFPGTLISFLVINEGGERAYGIELPRRDRKGPVA